MRLATIRLGGPTAVRVDGDEAVELAAPDVREVLDREGWQDWAAAADGPRRPSPTSTTPADPGPTRSCASDSTTARTSRRRAGAPPAPHAVRQVRRR